MAVCAVSGASDAAAAGEGCASASNVVSAEEGLCFVNSAEEVGVTSSDVVVPASGAIKASVSSVRIRWRNPVFVLLAKITNIYLRIIGAENEKNMGAYGIDNVNDIPMEDVLDEQALRINISKKEKKKCVDKGQSGAKKIKKVLQELSDEDEVGLTASQEERIISHSLEKIKKFLVETKGWRAIKPELFFPDLNSFIRSVNRLRGDVLFVWFFFFTDHEVYRLKKIMTKARATQIEDDD